MCLVSSFFCLLASLSLSVSPLVILANAGNHRTASVVARYCRFIASVVIGFALCSCWLWQVRFQMRHPECVDEWIPVCTGMTTGGGVLSFYVRVPLLMCLVSSNLLLFQHLPYNFGLSASFCLSARHPRERGDPLYSECCSSVVPLHCQRCCWFCSMWLLVVASAFPNVASCVCG
ncbi:putative secreted protein [Vibrio vulnificus]|nr:putative secreted protein [Vibrio vulnificus]OUD80397.1 putative secreted protein [Vibrio vulnificus]